MVAARAAAALPDPLPLLPIACWCWLREGSFVAVRGFDVIAWRTPWLMVLSHAAQTAAGAWLLAGRRRVAGH